MLTNVLGPGPAAVATALVPDLDHFRGSFGARGVVPLWRDRTATQPNADSAWLNHLSVQYGTPVAHTQVMAYCYALLSAPSYTRRFEEELRTPGPRIPLPQDPRLFARGVSMGEALLRLHTYRDVTVGAARFRGSVGEAFPTAYRYDDVSEEVRIGEPGVGVGPVSDEVWAFSVSGYRVLNGWLRHRIARKSKSPLDAIRPTKWTLTDELLELIWLVEATLARQPALDPG
jgi:Type ISP C-terminal specificity domain